MRIETNEKLARRNRRIAQYLFFASFAVLIGAFIITNQQALNPSTATEFLSIWLPTLILPIGLIITLISVRMTNLWVRQPRPESVLREGLKGMSNRTVLYNYYHIPARHVLIAPQGVFAITTRFQEGHFTVKGDKWSSPRGALAAFLRFFRQEAIGNPSQDAERAADHVRKLLAPIAPDIPVYPLVVFIDPRATFEAEDPIVPVLYAHPKMEPNLKEYMRQISAANYPTMTKAQIDAFESATL